MANKWLSSHILHNIFVALDITVVAFWLINLLIVSKWLIRAFVEHCVWRCWGSYSKIVTWCSLYQQFVTHITTFIPVTPNGVIDIIQHRLRWWLDCLRVLLISIMFMAAHINKLIAAGMLNGDSSAGVKHIFTEIGWRLVVHVCIKSYAHITDFSS